MADRSLQDLLESAGNPVELLRNSQAGPNVYPGVPAEYTNWRDEQTAWQQTCVIFNQSYHMADLAVEGPDALRLLSHLAVNSFEGFGVDDVLMARASSKAVFLHCLPAHRGEEVAASVVDGPQSRIWLQAENRMHAARGALAWLLAEGRA